jgi:hypothetical protein
MTLLGLEKRVLELELTLFDGTLGEFSWIPCEPYIYFAKPYDDPFPTLDDPIPTELHISLGAARRTYSLTSTSALSIYFEVAGRVGSKQSVIRYCDAPDFKHLGLGNMLRIYYIRREMEERGRKIEKFVFDGIWIPWALWDFITSDASKRYLFP